jgi:sulfide dehydrogenase cytochrome subunit
VARGQNRSAPFVLSDKSWLAILPTLQARGGSAMRAVRMKGQMDALYIAVAAVLVTVFVAPPAIAADAPPGATSCSGCHPAKRWVDTAVPRLAGRNPAEIVAAMQGFKSGALPATVMGRIAKGFSEEEIKAIAAWYGAQKE